MNTSKLRIKKIINFIRIGALVVSAFSGGFMFYEVITENSGLLSIILLPVFAISSIIAIVIPSKVNIEYLNKYLSSFVKWIGIILLTICILFVYNWLRNLSPVVFSVEFYSEEGIYLDFRENSTFRAQNTDLFGGSISYGKYEKLDSIIVLLDEVKFGDARMNDTLVLKSDGLSFTLEEPYRYVEKGILSFRRN